MKLLLVNAVNTDSSIEVVYPPLGLAYLSSSLRKQLPFVTVRIIDRGIEKALHEFEPDLVGVSSVSQNFRRATEIGEVARLRGIPTFVGGVHISMLPQSLPKAFDFGVIGEGEKTIVELVELFHANRKPHLADLRRIRGLALHTNDGVELTDARPLIEDLDTIPFPDREALDIPLGRTTYLFTSRGCPYSCTFCASSRFWNRTRWFSAEYVIREIEDVVNRYKCWGISFYDDLFVANFPRLERITEMILSRGINKRVKLSFACRANLVNERLVDVFKSLGNVHMICMGLESGCQRTLSYLKGGHLTVERNQEAVELLAQAGINVQGTFIIGAPDETEEEILQTLHFIKNSRLNHFNVYVLTPFPGTPIWDVAKNQGLVSDEMDWGRLAVDIWDRQGDRILLSSLPREKILALYQLFMREKKRRWIRYMAHRAISDPTWFVRQLRRRLWKVRPAEP